jgi:hypothetical protein
VLIGDEVTDERDRDHSLSSSRVSVETLEDAVGDDVVPTAIAV